MKYPAFDEQAQDPLSIYNYHKDAIRARNTFPAIARGKTTALSEISDGDICAFTRTLDADPEGRWEAQNLLIVINASDEAKTVDLSGSSTLQETMGTATIPGISYQLVTGEDWCSAENSTLTMAPYGIVIIEY